MSHAHSLDRKAREAGRDAWSMLEGLLLALRGLTRPVGAQLLEHARRAHALLASLESIPVYERIYYERLDGAQHHAAELVAGLQELEPPTDASSMARTAQSIVQAIAQCRASSVEAAVVRDRQGVHGTDGSDGTRAARFRASVGVPALHRLARPALGPLVEPQRATARELLEGSLAAIRGPEVDGDEPSAEASPARLVRALQRGGQPVTLTGLSALAGAVATAAPQSDGLVHDDELPAAPAPPVEAHLLPAEIEHLQWTARDCLTDIAGLSNLRVPLDDAPWTHGEPFEERLLASLDALVSLGTPPNSGSQVGWNVLDEVQRFGWDSFVPDFGRQFTRALVLGCVAGSDSVRAALLALRQINPATHAGVRDALALASNPTVGPQITELLRECKPALIPPLLEVLRFRREASLATLTPLAAHPSLSVTQMVARTLGYVEPNEGVLATLHGMLDEEGSDAVCLDAATSLLLLGDESALHFVRAKLADRAMLANKTRYGYLRLLALAGRAEDLPAFHRALGYGPRDTELVGWFGHVELVDWLIMALEGANELREATGPWPYAVELAIVGALHRITNAPVRDEPFDDVHYAFESRPALRASTWMGWWEDNANRFDASRRYRFGEPYTPRATVDELLAPTTPTHVRADAALELAIVLGPTRFEANDWVARQRVTLAEVQLGLERADKPYAAGSFIADQLKRRASYFA